MGRLEDIVGRVFIAEYGQLLNGNQDLRLKIVESSVRIR